jgi:hypothetical protein
MNRCCGTSCFAGDAHFVRFHELPAPASIVLCSTLLCAPSEAASYYTKGEMLSNVVSEDCGMTQNQLNYTSCYSRDGGSAFGVWDKSNKGDDIVNCSFLTICHCSGKCAVDNYRKKRTTTISFSNCYNNSVTSAVIYGHNSGVNLESCIFFGNQQDMGYYSIGTTCVVMSCVFDGPSPSAKYFSGTYNYRNLITASIDIPRFENEQCALVPQPVLSASQSNQFDSSSSLPLASKRNGTKSRNRFLLSPRQSVLPFFRPNISD